MPDGFDIVQKPAFIGVDWGTSNARFILVGEDGASLAEKAGAGIARLAGAAAIEAECFEAIDPWIKEHGSLPVVMAGMVGSNIGWQLAAYVPSPATAAEIAAATVSFTARGVSFHILPGVSTRRADGLPDVMRGEETQIFGALAGDDALICLPGTHAKWAQVRSRAIITFHTALTGELLDIVGRNSILLNPKRPPHAVPDAAFMKGVACIKNSSMGIESLIFTVRSRQIIEAVSQADSEAYLAGLCIGADVRSALQVYGMHQPLTLVGTPALLALYAAALEIFGLTSRQINGGDAVLAGLHAAYKVCICG
jgi:2-dehydro-3-deoxygalactonokinase